MNLLIDQWIPVRPLEGVEQLRIALRELLCGDGKWELSLPRDDMELAALQLVICLTQVILMPKDAAELRGRIAKPLRAEDYDAAIGPPFHEWFQLDHPKYPFMQVRGVGAKDLTPMDKLMAGVTGATNSCFVNQQGLAERLCHGCAAIALFNQATCAPSFGGGFKAGLRGSAPVTTLIQGDHLRRTVWLNVLSRESVAQTIPWHRTTTLQQPTWLEPIEAGEIVPAQHIGFARGLFWQPAHIELTAPVPAQSCSCCGGRVDKVFESFNKAKFVYTVVGTWPHPHSPRITTSKKGQSGERFIAFTISSPSWTQLSRFVVQQEFDDASKVEGQQPAAVIDQTRRLYGNDSRKLHLLVGGYRNNKASILARRHDVFTLNHGWDRNGQVIHHLVTSGRGYRDALYKALYVFVNGVRDIKGAGVKVNQSAEAQFYRRSEPIVEHALARIDFENPGPELSQMRKALRSAAEELFDESVRPYLNDPELIRTLAVARRTLWKRLNSLDPRQNKGEKNGTEKTP
jgi:CRISPR system Cascade subunit CasA